MGEARRLIEQGGVQVNNERCARVDHELSLSAAQSVLVQVGKRKFLRVRGM